MLTAAILSSLSTRRRSASRFVADEARDLAETGVRIIAAANEQLGFTHPQATGWDHISFCQFAGPLTREGNELQGSNAVVVRPGKIDRSPTGSGCSARMATQDARGLMGEGDVYRACSIIGSEFICPDRVPGDRRPAGHNPGRFWKELGSPA